MSFPTTAVLDDFNRANDPNLGANWTEPVDPAHAGLQIIGNQAAADAAAGASAYWSAATFSGTGQEAFLTLAVLNAVTWPFGVYLRAKEFGAGTWDGYNVNQNDGAAQSATTLYRIDNGSYVQLGPTVTQTWNAGDGFGGEHDGATLRIYRRAGAGGSWTQVASQADATYPGAGNIGMNINDSAGRADDFGGGATVPELLMPLGHMRLPMRTEPAALRY